MMPKSEKNQIISKLDKQTTISRRNYLALKVEKTQKE